MLNRTQRKTLWMGIQLGAVLLVLAAGWACNQGLPSVSDLPDEEKKRIVYDMYARYREESFPDVPQMSPHEAMELMQRGRAVFVDVRTPRERRVSMLAGAVSLQELYADLDNYRDKIIISYCTISYRSAGVTRELAGKGFAAYNLAGGLLAWVLEGGEIHDSSGITRRLHVYGEKWNYPAQGYTAVW